jgi:hypothetical protein
MRITKANAVAIKYSCLYFHYAKSIPSCLYAYNIYNDNNEWCGCILFGVGANNHMANSLNCITGTCLELQRVALNGKQGHNATSKAVAMAMREVKKDAVLLKCLFSYADTKQKHFGIIYQATNWIYIGESKGTEYEKDGKQFHKRSVSNMKKRTGKTREELGFQSVTSMNKHIYVFPYDKKIRKKLQAKQRAYPKRKTENNGFI